MLKLFNNYIQKKSFGNNRLSNVTASTLIDLVVCETLVEDCFLDVCDQCNEKSPSSILQHYFDIIDEDDVCLRLS